jgi:phasin family protein
MATTNTNPFAQWSKMFGEIKTPTVDVNQVVSQIRRNAETSSAVLQIITESAQAVARRQAEILRSNAEQALKASKDLMNHSTPESAASKQADFAKSWLDYNVNSLREIAEMSTKSTQEAFDVINKRVAEQVKEFTDVASHTTHSKKKAA